MDRNTFRKIGKYFVDSYTFPTNMSFSFIFFFLSVFMTLGLLISTCIKRYLLTFSSTSLLGMCIIFPLFLFISLIIPIIILGHKETHSFFGSFTGIGPLSISFISGIPLSLIYIAFHNLNSFLCLKFLPVTIFPAFFFVNNSQSFSSLILQIIFDTIIPLICISVFFYGFMWKSLSAKNIKLVASTVAICISLFSLNVNDFLAVFLVALWFAFLRDRTNNIWSIVICGICTKISVLIMSKFICYLDIYTMYSTSDIDTLFWYSEIPTLIMGIVLIFMFVRFLNDFKTDYFKDFYFGRTKSPIAESTANNNLGIKDLFPLPLISGIIIFFIIWFLLFKGVFL